MPGTLETMSLFGLDLSTYFFIIGLFVLVDALKVYLEIWNRPVQRAFSSDLSKVTALIPTHNGRDVIRETVTDLINAGLPRDQILVVDDGSTEIGRATCRERVDDPAGRRTCRKE